LEPAPPIWRQVVAIEEVLPAGVSAQWVFGLGVVGGGWFGVRSGLNIN